MTVEQPAQNGNGNGNGKVLEKLALWIGRLGAVGALVWAGSARFSALEQQGTRVLDELSKRPTSDAVKVQVMEAVQPLTQGMTEVRVQLQALSERVQRLEASGK